MENMLEQERAEKLSRAIKEMPEQMRTCFLLRYDQGRKYKEIAVIMKITIDTVKAHLHQAKKRLKLVMQEPSED
jgi:RNA polymerase sigma-70 factor (ECF subfamily)